MDCDEEWGSETSKSNENVVHKSKSYKGENISPTAAETVYLKSKSKSNPATSTTWYKGCKIYVGWLQQHFLELEPVKLGK